MFQLTSDGSTTSRQVSVSASDPCHRQWGCEVSSWVHSRGKNFLPGDVRLHVLQMIDTKPSGLRGGLTHRCMPRPSPMLAPSKVMFHVVMHAGMLVLCFSLQGSA